MSFSLLRFIIVCCAFIISLLIGKSIKTTILKVVVYVVETGFFIYSGIGLAFYSIERAGLYILQYCLASLSFALTTYFLQNRFEYKIKKHYGCDEPVFKANGGVVVKFFAFIYLCTFIFPFIYPSVSIYKIFDIVSFINNFHALSSSYKLSLQSDSLYQLVCSTIRVIALPWFYVFLYRIKGKPLFFIIIYSIPVYLGAVSNYYISRNDLAVYLCFVFIYLYKEEIVSRAVLRQIAIIGVPFLLIIFSRLMYLRAGLDALNIGYIKVIKNLWLDEISFVQNYPRLSGLTDQVSTVMFFIYVSTCFIPMSIRGLFGIKEINLARVLSNSILNSSYGQLNYYLILPSVLGEGILLFGNYFSWLYLVVFALFIYWFLTKLCRNKSLEYLTIYFVIDVFRQFRGGSQFVISSWAAAIIPFLVICVLVKQIGTKHHYKRDTYKNRFGI